MFPVDIWCGEQVFTNSIVEAYSSYSSMFYTIQLVRI